MCQKLNVLDDFHASYFAITREDMDNFHFTKGDAEGLVNEPLKIKGMKLSIALREDSLKENTIWLVFVLLITSHVMKWLHNFIMVEAI